MTFLPIVERELRVRARLKSTYHFRLIGAVIAIVVVGFLLVVSGAVGSPVTMGTKMFDVLASTAYVFCLFEGARNTADCLSEEKRAGTLGLLFLTDLRGYDVVLGKFMAASLNSFYGLLAIFPPLAIPLMLGGVTAGEFWRLVLTLICTLFFSLTAGMFVSALSRHERKAWGATAALVLGFTLMLPLLGITLAWITNTPAGGASKTVRWLISPMSSMTGLFAAQYSAAPHLYWLSLLLTNTLSGCFLATASFVLPGSWQDAPPRRRNSWLRKLREEPSRGDEAGRQIARRQLLDTNPIVWLADSGEHQKFYLWLLVTLAGGAGLIGWIAGGGSQRVGLVIFVCAEALHFALAVWVASQASHMFPDARDSGALELLLATPLGTGEIVEGHFQALRRLFFGPVAALVAMEAILILSQVALLAGVSPSGGFLLLAGLGLCLVTAVMDLYAVAYFGLWMGLRSRKSSQALTKTVAYALLIPMLASLCCVFVWPILGVVKNLIFINYGQERLRRRFREVVAERFSSVAEEMLIPPPAVAAPGQLPPVMNKT